MIKRLFLYTLFSIFVTFLYIHPVLAETIKMSGSTTVQKRIFEPAGKAIKEKTGYGVTIKGIGSGGGFKELTQGKVDASIASSPLTLLLQKIGLDDNGTYMEHIITKDVIVPVVHLSNPVSMLSWHELSHINSGKIVNWKEVGGPDLEITVITSHGGSATRAVFQKMVMNGSPYVKSARKVKSTRQEITLVARFKGGIGAVSEGFVKLNPGKVKVIKTDEISRPLSIITKGKPSPQVQAVINFLMSPEAVEYFR